MPGLTVLIVEPKLAPVLGKRLWSDPQVSVFPIAEALRALEAIVLRPPAAVILDPTFVTTSRGAALISRIRHDARLARVELRVLIHADDMSTIPLKEPVSSAEAAAVSQPPDRWGTRRSVRVPIRNNVTVLVNGERCELVNLSLTGAQVLSLGRVSPQQPVRVTLLDGPAETRLYGIIAWSAAEPMGAALQYRAGLSFTNPDATILEAFCLRYGMGTVPTGCSSSA